MRVLHANSFIEDPTRIYRAVRFAVRLGFEIDSQTEGYIRYSIASGIYDRVQTEISKAPALQTRLKAELKYILQATYWQSALRLLADLGALRCIHPTLTLDRQLWQQLRYLERWLYQDPTHPVEQVIGDLPLVLPDPWQLRLEVLLAALEPEYRELVASHLQLPADCIHRLRDLATDEATILSALPNCRLTSQVVQLLDEYRFPTLLLIALRQPRWVRRLIWRYVKDWVDIAPPLNGHDLQQLGYRPGPEFKQILQQLRNAQLDHEIGDRATALTFLAEHFPR
ncbi:hypothetical protein [Neosynechococcus sphagnicola]|uniref:hypothetical protein n=1 Tax=Neosynechococcus sphagnicola TaxID=1501145 RepID=UPI000A4E4C53|nr:hypothetical protein [Neosynechococcus sphagnicola]